MNGTGRGFRDCALNRRQFVCDLVRVLPLYGVDKLWKGVLAGSQEEKLDKAINDVREHVWKRYGRTKGPDTGKSYGLFEIALVLSRSHHHNKLHHFWSAIENYSSYGPVRWHTDCIYELTSSPEDRAHLFKRELEPDYARFVRACAKFIAKRLRSAVNAK